VSRDVQIGQALVELGIGLAVLVTLVVGSLDISRAWMIANMVTNAARDGARIGAVVPSTKRNGSGFITDTSGIKNQVLAEIRDVIPTSGFTVTVSQPTVNGVNVVQVRVDAVVPYIFKIIGPTFTVARTATFRDEGR